MQDSPIHKSDLEEHDYTAQCPGCSAARDGKVPRSHNPRCRDRLRECISATDEGKARIERALNRPAKRPSDPATSTGTNMPTALAMRAQRSAMTKTTKVCSLKVPIFENQT